MKTNNEIDFSDYVQYGDCEDVQEPTIKTLVGGFLLIVLVCCIVLLFSL